ncbi:MAG: glycosyltransferase family 4 protein [Phycisphaerae bacterium]|jgi:UDP-glucose:(heptosyl)LPS alpha-1,3-glucosyltransferase
MKLAIITERANLRLGGAERSVFELTAKMVLLGVDVKILAATGTTRSRRVEILCGSGKKRVGLKEFKIALSAHFKENHYDIIHSVLPFDFVDVYQPRGGSYPEAAIRNAASYDNTAIRIFKLLTNVTNFRRTSLACAEKRICKNSDTPVIAALSEYVKNQFKKYYNLPDERIFVIPNGIRPSAAVDKAKADRLRRQIFDKLNIKQADEPVFFLFGAHNFRLKGLTPLVKAIAILTNKFTKRPAYVIVSGRGSAGKYRRLAGKLGVKDKILFLGPAGSIRYLLAVCDVAVLPTYYDPSSRFVLEALAADRPVITTKYNGAKDLFVAGRHGRVFDSPDDVDSLAEAMQFYCNAENITAAKKAIVDDNIKTKVSIETHCKKLLELYKKIKNKKL